MEIRAFFDSLNYSDSPFFYEGSRLDEIPSYSHIFRVAREKCGLKGVYALDRNPGRKLPEKSIVPLVYVCEAKSEKQAIEIHRLVWNQNTVPFLLIATPKFFRLYPGFKFDTSIQGRDKDQNLLEVAKSTNEVLERFSDFKADAIKAGSLWQNWAKQISPNTRVDQNLLKNLDELGNWLREHDLPRQVAHALIGKYVYLRYLKDRGILSDRKLEQWGFNFDSVFGRNATISGFQALVKKLDQWLNGNIFPIPQSMESSLKNEHFQKIASVFLGDEVGSRQMHLDFQAYNFEHIPIETLSMVYQQFLHAEERGAKQGAYYTPIHLVNFILDELDSKIKLEKGMKVFDPACGSGAFIVQCFRRIIERELATRKGSGLKPSELRSLLVENIYGVDIDEDACNVTELSLVLTLLDYIHPPDLEEAGYQHFNLPALRDKNIFFCKNGFFDDKSKQMKVLAGMKFDWIVGNPPWNQLPSNPKDPADQSALSWIESNKDEYPVNQKQYAEAFAWKASTYLSDHGITGFLLPGTTLFKSQKNACLFRKRFFSKMDVWCVVNFSNLRHLLFQDAENPAVAFFYGNSKNASDKSDSILTYAPLAVNQTSRFEKANHGPKKLWTVFVQADEMREIPYKDAVSGEAFPWKMAMWGTTRDKYLLVSLKKALVTMSAFAKTHNLNICQGLELRNKESSEKIDPLPEVAGKIRLDINTLKGCERIFHFPENTLKKIPASEAFVRKGRGKKPLRICHPPHIIVDAHRRFSVYSEKFIVVPPRHIGIAGNQTKKSILKALALYLNSDFVKYQQCMSSSSWGIERGRLTQKDLLSLPVPLDQLSSKEMQEWAELHDEIVKKSMEYMEKDSFFQLPKEPEAINSLVDKMNERVNVLLGLSENERCLVHDFVSIKMKLNDGAVPVEAVERASSDEIKAYCEALKRVLDDFLDDNIKNQHEIIAQYTSTMVLLSIEHPEIPPANPIVVNEVSDDGLEAALKGLEENLRSEKGKWICFQKNLKVFLGRKTYFFKTRQRISWLQSQAFSDGDEFIAEKLTIRKSN